VAILVHGNIAVITETRSSMWSVTLHYIPVALVALLWTLWSRIV